ncbi:hypothetical protein FIBSPDRAFT_890716 [Athelia psychrophila]|uniref:Uncharacterized protein n=1 Tax=Athelia psychrophila TaxID=1759441 RepID=A0A166KGX5_9AGAM|nr:hypothetical protein FIBSPDRAFT_890716 [Fibularhizoctonia sp. CBS 109695]
MDTDCEFGPGYVGENRLAEALFREFHTRHVDSRLSWKRFKFSLSNIAPDQPRWSSGKCVSVQLGAVPVSTGKEQQLAIMLPIIRLIYIIVSEREQITHPNLNSIPDFANLQVQIIGKVWGPVAAARTQENLGLEYARPRTKMSTTQKFGQR